MPWIARGHHISSVEHLLNELWYGQCSVLLWAFSGEWRKAGHEKMQTRKWHHVYSQFTKIGVQLAGEAQACRHTRHCQLNYQFAIEIIKAWPATAHHQIGWKKILNSNAQAPELLRAREEQEFQTTNGKKRQIVQRTETRWFRSLYVGDESFSVRKQMS